MVTRSQPHLAHRSRLTCFTADQNAIQLHPVSSRFIGVNPFKFMQNRDTRLHRTDATAYRFQIGLFTHSTIFYYLLRHKVYRSYRWHLFKFFFSYIVALETWFICLKHWIFVVQANTYFFFAIFFLFSFFYICTHIFDRTLLSLYRFFFFWTRRNMLYEAYLYGNRLPILPLARSDGLVWLNLTWDKVFWKFGPESEKSRSMREHVASLSVGNTCLDWILPCVRSYDVEITSFKI